MAVGVYTSPAEDSATIRAAFKRMGHTSRAVSVRCNSYSMGSSIDVVVKDPTLPLWRAEKTAIDVAEHIRHCPISGEILSGGNRFVHARHSRECREILARRHESDLIDALAAATVADDRNAIFRIHNANNVGVAIVSANNCRLWGLGDHGRAGVQAYCGNAAAITEIAYLVSLYDDDQRNPGEE